MHRRQGKKILSHLTSDEGNRVLAEVLKRHPDLTDEAIAVAKEMIDDVSVEAVAEDVVDLVTSIGLEDLDSRAGKHSWGYVQPGEAAWELLEESIEGVRDDMRRWLQAGMGRPAERICQGIVLGLYRVRSTNSDGALGWAPDFPAESAAYAISTLVELYPPSRRLAVGRRLISAVEPSVEEWVEMLHRVVDPVASSKRGRKKPR